MPSNRNDERYMHRALELARQGVALTSPNPCVGAVVVDHSGQVVGEGTHQYEHRKHAEALALERAGARARGSTLYLNLEPCCHTGRTGPCVEAVIRAGVRRVVVAMSDPNPLVAGKGFERLRAAGIEVETGLGEAEARKLNEAFTCWIRTGRPLGILKSAMTLDGKIAAAAHHLADAKGASTSYITGERARAHVQELRHAADAILVGVGTVMADDPLLTDRSGLPRRRPLLRVIVDSQLRIPLESRLVQTAHDDLLVFCTSCDPARRRELEQRNVRVEQIPSSGGVTRVSLNPVVQRLGEEQITSLIIEGGSQVNGSALMAGIVDKFFFYYAPTILGAGAVPFCGGGDFHLRPELRVQNLTLHRFGEDFAVEAYLRDPYA